MKTNYLTLLIFLTAVVMAGCTTAPFSTSDKGTQNKPGDSLAEAKALRQQGNWADAIRILQEA